jgi:hypothetical protein
MLIWLLAHFSRPTLRERWERARPHAEPTYDAYPDRVEPAPRSPRPASFRDWLQRLRGEPSQPTYEAYPDAVDDDEGEP